MKKMRTKRKREDFVKQDMRTGFQDATRVNEENQNWWETMHMWILIRSE